MAFTRILIPIQSYTDYPPAQKHSGRDKVQTILLDEKRAFLLQKKQTIITIINDILYIFMLV